MTTFRGYLGFGVFFVLLAAIGAGGAAAAEGDVAKVDGDSVVKYILSCEKPYGGFGPIDNDYADVAWTWYAAAALKHLGAPVPHPEKILRKGGVLENFARETSPRLYHKVALYLMLAPEPKAREFTDIERLHLQDDGGFGGPPRVNPATTVHNTYYAIWMLSRGGRVLDEVRKRCAKTPEFLASRQNDDGSWNNFPAPGVPYKTPNNPGVRDYTITPTIGHVQLTYFALAAY